MEYVEYNDWALLDGNWPVGFESTFGMLNKNVYFSCVFFKKIELDLNFWIVTIAIIYNVISYLPSWKTRSTLSP